jgi:hypothetical protein
MQKKDLRYRAVQLLIKEGRIQIFSQIVKFIPKTKIAKDIHTNNNRINRLLAQPHKLTLEEIEIIANVFNIEMDQIISLIMEQKKRDLIGKFKKAGK